MHLLRQCDDLGKVSPHLLYRCHEVIGVCCLYAKNIVPGRHPVTRGRTSESSSVGQPEAGRIPQSLFPAPFPLFRKAWTLCSQIEPDW